MQKKAINLGKQLVAELRREPDVDTLSRWMAHYVAEQIVIAENATGAKKAAAETKCFQTILALWNHRSTFPHGRRPFEAFGPTLQALARLDPDEPRSYYHSIVKPATEQKEPKEPDVVQKLLNFIFAIDSAARILIDVALSEITKTSLSEQTMAMLKNSLPVPSSNDVTAIRILIKRSKKLDQPDPDDEQQVYRQMIQERLEKLEEFSTACIKVRVLLKKRLKGTKSIGKGQELKN